MPPKIQQKSKEQKMAAAMAGGKGKKKKWSKGKNRDKVDNKVLFSKEQWERFNSEVPKMKLITVSTVVEKLKINAGLCRRALNEMADNGARQRHLLSTKPASMADAELANATQARQKEITEELRQAHKTAFDNAVAILEAEMSVTAGAGQAVAVLQGVRNDFEEWEDGHIDGPMPALSTVNSLRKSFKYTLVDKQAWKHAGAYTTAANRIFDTHRGAGTAMSYKFFALFNKGLAATRSALRTGSGDRALCEAISLTKAMLENDDWYADTDVPEKAVRVVGALGALWRDILEAVSRPCHMLLAWLEDVKVEWEGEASNYLGVKLSFSFNAAPSVPVKTRQGTGETIDFSEKPPVVKKQRLLSEDEGPTKDARPPSKIVPERISEETERWLHRLDGQLARRQASHVQLHCSAEGSTRKRVVIVSGAYPLRAVGFCLAEAFGRAVDDFDPHPHKGRPPPGLLVLLCRDGRTEVIKKTVKIVQALQDPGDSIRIVMQGLMLKVILDAIKFKSDPGFEVISRRPMPRCVGGDRALTPSLLNRLNRVFLHGRKPQEVSGCTKREQISATLERMARPIAFEQGEVFVEGWSDASDEENAVPGHKLAPLVL